MGTYLRVLSCLGLAGELALVGSNAVRESLAPRSHAPVVVMSDSNRHAAQDLQSLMLHREAVAFMEKALLQARITRLMKDLRAIGIHVIDG